MHRDLTPYIHPYALIWVAAHSNNACGHSRACKCTEHSEFHYSGNITDHMRVLCAEYVVDTVAHLAPKADHVDVD